MSLAGVGLILFSIFWIRSDMIFPGWVALIPCAGAAMVIHAGGQSWVAQYILASRPMVFIGLLSYSLYLWHWPVLVAIRMRTGTIHLDPAVAVGAIVPIFLFAYLSWRFVEKPFRDRQTMAVDRMLALLGAGTVVALAIAGVSILKAGFPGRLPESSQIALAAAQDIDHLRIPCAGMRDRSQCRFGNPDAPITYVVVGDSHAAAIRPAIEVSRIMEDEAGTLYWKGACPLLDGAELVNHPERAGCADFRSSVWKEIDANPILRTVILAGRWPFQMTGWLPESGGSNRTWLVDDETVSPSIKENGAVLHRSLTRTLDRLSSMGLEVIIIGSTPEPGFDVPHTVAMAQYAGIEVPRGVPRWMVEARAGAADTLLTEIVEDRADVRLFSFWKAFCDDEWCDIERAGVPIYQDDDHLSKRGAIEVAAPALAASKLTDVVAGTRPPE